MGFILFVAVVAFIVWSIPTNRVKIKKRMTTHPKEMQLFRPPVVYVTIFVGVILYGLGGFWLTIVILGLVMRWFTNPELQKRLEKRVQLLPETKGVPSTRSVHSSTSPLFSFLPSMDILFWLKKATYWIIAGIIILFVLSKGLPWYTVSPGEVALVARLGKLQDYYATEGLNFKIPIIDKVILINIQTQKVEATADAASKDLQNISATIAVNGSVQASAAKELYRNLGDSSLVAEKIINPSIQESVKAATAKYTAEELITKRTAVSQDIKVSLVEKLEKWGIVVSDVNIVNFQFSSDFNVAIEKKVKAEQEALAEKNKLESVKFQAQQKIEQSKAEAESIRIQAEAIKSQGGLEYVNLKWIEKWDGKLPQTSLGESNGFILNLKQ